MGHKIFHMKGSGNTFNGLYLCLACSSGAAHNPESGLHCTSIHCKCGCMVREMLKKPVTLAPLKEPVTVDKIEKVLRTKVE